MSAITSLGAAQTTQALNLPRRFDAPSPPREIGLEALRQRNALLDFLFYDLGVLSAAEAQSLAPTYAAEGAILCVGPSSAPSLSVWPDHASFVAEGPKGVTALVVAGVGSSALGAAAFARNVADATGKPVLAVVSGYGLSDLMTEALGGFFLFGQINGMRHLFEPIDALLRPGVHRIEDPLETTALELVRESLDVRTLVALLGSGQTFDLVVGHSKGNLVISEALFEIGDAAPERLDDLAKTARLITISARIMMPRAFPVVTDIIGALDGFGELNSRPGIPADVRVPMAWHHTNTELPFHLPVTRTLIDVLAKLH